MHSDCQLAGAVKILCGDEWESVFNALRDQGITAPSKLKEALQEQAGILEDEVVGEFARNYQVRKSFHAASTFCKLV